MGERRIALVAATLVLAVSTGASSQAPATVSTPAQTIKITLRVVKGQCQLAPVSPQRGGFYANDTVIWNVENGCKTSATVRIEKFAYLGVQGTSEPAPLAPFVEGQNFSNETTVGADLRGQVIVRVLPNPKGGRYRYSVALGDAPPQSCAFDICKDPPCPEDPP